MREYCDMRIYLHLLLLSACYSFAAQEAIEPLDELTKEQKYDALRLAIKNNLISRVFDLSRVDAPCTDPEIFGFACEVGELEIVNLLLDLGAPPNQPSRNYCFHRYGYYPIHRAALAGKSDIVRILHQRGVNYDQQTDEGITPLQLAASHGKEELTKILYSRTLVGLNYNLSTRKNLAHHIAVSGNIDLMQWYLGTPYATVDVRDQFGNLPVFKAAFWGELAMVKFLLRQRPSQLHEINNDGWDLMAAAAKNNRTEVVCYLRSKGLTLVKQDKVARQTAVHRAAADCYGNLVREGIKRDGFKPKARDKEGWDLTHYASRNGCLDVLRILHEQYGLSLNRKTHSSEKLRPVHIAAASGHVHLLQYFAEKGIDLLAKDAKEMTPLDHAKNYSRKEAISYLQRHPAERHRQVSSVGSIKQIWRRRQR